MQKSKLAILAVISTFILVQLACGVSINTGAGQNIIPAETSIAMTLASLPGNKLSNPQVIVVTPYFTQAPLSNQNANASSSLQNTQTPSATPLPCNKPKMTSETIKDDTIFDPGKTFIKTWTIRNDGICTWDNSYRFIFMGGTQMGGVASMSLPKVVVPGDTVTLSVSLKAPSTDGAYTGTWVLKSGNGELFGNYWAKIIVGLPAGPFAVTSALVTSNSDMVIPGHCPKPFELKTVIDTNGPGTVTYWYQMSNGFKSPTHSENFSAAGRETAYIDVKMTTISSSGNYRVDVYIDKPNHQLFQGQVLFFNCD
jgi:hypothetical protein